MDCQSCGEKDIAMLMYYPLKTIYRCRICGKDTMTGTLKRKEKEEDEDTE